MKLINKQNTHILGIKGEPEHKYWKYKIAEKFKEQGYEVEFEKWINGHYADLVAIKNGTQFLLRLKVGSLRPKQISRKTLKLVFSM